MGVQGLGVRGYRVLGLGVIGSRVGGGSFFSGGIVRLGRSQQERIALM